MLSSLPEQTFASKFLAATALYQRNNSGNRKAALIQLYKLQRQLDQESQVFSEDEPGLLGLIQREKIELFGLFPPKDDQRAKHIMVALEVFRLHHRHLDIRNAYTTLKRLTDRYPNMPMLVSRFGRFCLEIGRKVEAVTYFSVI